MLYSEIIAVCSDIHTKYINTLCRKSAESFIFKYCKGKIFPRTGNEGPEKE
jgi:hypothetical protein